MNNKAPYPKDKHLRAALQAHTALSEMINGTARTEEWYDLCDAINMCDALLGMGKLDGEITRQHVERSIEGMVDALEMPSGQMRMHAQHAKSLRLLVNTYDQAFERMARETIDRAALHTVLKIGQNQANMHKAGSVEVDVMRSV